jgi:2-polyprenyl-3-methyl-5-hydroxy-6-metoxy-1,4-benzoquinol methylase
MDNDSCGAAPVFSVLEHVREPLPCLQAIKRILKSNGMLIVAVPNGACVARVLFGELWNGCHL